MEQTCKHRAVQLGIDGVTLEGRLAIPPDPAGLVVLVNGQWGVQYGSRETDIAAALRRDGFGTFLVELLTPEESVDRGKRFATTERADRLDGVTDWLDHQDRTAALDRGFIGIGPGAATVMRMLIAEDPGAQAVVSFNGGPTLASEPLEDAPVPALLIVDGREEHLLQGHRQARERLGNDQHHHVILHPDDDDPETVNAEVASLAAAWSECHFETAD